MIETTVAVFILVIGLYSSFSSKASERFQLPVLLAIAAFIALLPKSPTLAITSLLYFAIGFAFIKRVYNRPRIKTFMLAKKNRALRVGMFGSGVCVASGTLYIALETLPMAGAFMMAQETVVNAILLLFLVALYFKRGKVWRR